MKDKVTKQVTESYRTVKRIVDNAEHLVLASSLIITAGYNWYDLTIRPVGKVELYIRLFASVVIALKGAIEVLKFFNKENN